VTRTYLVPTTQVIQQAPTVIQQAPQVIQQAPVIQQQQVPVPPAAEPQAYAAPAYAPTTAYAVDTVTTQPACDPGYGTVNYAPLAYLNTGVSYLPGSAYYGTFLRNFAFRNLGYNVGINRGVFFPSRGVFSTGIGVRAPFVGVGVGRGAFLGHGSVNTVQRTRTVTRTGIR
jgi:hypothetical protein